MARSAGESGTKEDVNGREQAILRELLKLSNSSYSTLVENPVVRGFSGWDNVQPRAAYDFSPPPKPTPQKKSNRYLRGQRPKPATAPAAVSYMSGELDKNYSYVYTPGLSKRCKKELARNTTANHPVSLLQLPPGYPFQPHPSMPQPPVVYPPTVSGPAQKSSKVFSTIYLDPNISQPPALQQKEAHLQSELSRVVKMQMKPELLVEQIIIENRLRALGGMKSQSHRSLNLEGVKVDPKMIPNLDKGATMLSKKDSHQSRSAPSLIPQSLSPQQPPKPPSKTKPKRRVKPILDWCSLHGTDAAPSGSLHRTSGAIIASAKKEVSGMKDALSIKTHSSPKVSKGGAVSSTRPLPSFNVNDNFMSSTGFRLPSLAPQPLGARNHSASNHSQIQTVEQTKLQIM